MHRTTLVLVLLISHTFATTQIHHDSSVHLQALLPSTTTQLESIKTHESIETTHSISSIHSSAIVSSPTDSSTLHHLTNSFSSSTQLIKQHSIPWHALMQTHHELEPVQSLSTNTISSSLQQPSPSLSIQAAIQSKVYLDSFPQPSSIHVEPATDTDMAGLGLFSSYQFLLDTNISPSNVVLCPNNCSRIGTCNSDGQCDCPKVIYSWWRVQASNCKSEREEFGYAWPYFIYSWLLVYTLVFVLLTYFNYLTFKANDWQLGGVRHVCLCLIHASGLFRFIFFSIDPYSVSSIASPIIMRMILSLFYLFSILAYVLMALHWIEICRTGLALSPSKTLGYSQIASGFIVSIYFALEVAICVVQAQKKQNKILFLSDTIYMGTIMVLISPLYMYCGHLFLARLGLIRQDKRGKRDQMISKVRVMAFGPPIAGLASVVIFIVKFTKCRNNPFLFIIGESASHFAEVITIALFLYGILLDPVSLL
ncbi:hypothetical protein MT418_002249 [Batrachochytrium dendrobatidis]